jgi:hypothetical protein
MANHAAGVFAIPISEPDVYHATAESSVLKDLTDSFEFRGAQRKAIPSWLIAPILQGIALVCEYTLSFSQDFADIDVFQSSDKWASVIVSIHFEHHGKLVELPCELVSVVSSSACRGLTIKDLPDVFGPAQDVPTQAHFVSAKVHDDMLDVEEVPAVVCRRILL